MELREKQFNLRLSEKEFEDFNKCASISKLTRSDYLRLLLAKGVLECRKRGLL